MSGKLMGLCYNLKITRSQREILQAYADHADEFGVCWPSNDKIAWKCDISPRQVKRIKQQIFDLGLMWIVENPQGGRGQITVYQINVAALEGTDFPELQKKRTKGDAIMSPLSVEKRDDPGTVKGDISTAKDDSSRMKGDISTRKGDTAMSAKGDAIMSPKPSIESATSEPTIKTSSHTPTVCVSNCNGNGDSDSLRSSGASSLR
jgi:hypothetical protein